MSEPEEKVTIQAHNFAPSELAMVAPDIAMQKYLEAGYRPSLRKFFEFKPMSVSKGGLSRYDGEGAPNKNSSVIGSSIVKSHGTTVITYISASLIEDSFEAINDYRTKLASDLITSESDPENVQYDLHYKNGCVYPVVEIAKGLSGVPTPEEIELGEQLYRSIFTSGCIPRRSLSVEIGLKTVDEEGNVDIIHKGDDPTSDEILSNLTDKSFSYVLEARIQVFGNTGTVYDMCHAGLIKALKDTKLPYVYLSEKETILRSRRGKSTVSDQAIEGYDLVCDSRQYRDLVIDNSKISWSTTFGILDIDTASYGETEDVNMDDGEAALPAKSSALLVDLEGDIETSIEKRISVSVNSEGKIVGLQIQKAGGGSSNSVQREAIDHAVKLAMQRSLDLIPSL